jgi:hypothetical protein
MILLCVAESFPRYVKPCASGCSCATGRTFGMAFLRSCGTMSARQLFVPLNLSERDNDRQTRANCKAVAVQTRNSPRPSSSLPRVVGLQVLAAAGSTRRR